VQDYRRDTDDCCRDSADENESVCDSVISPHGANSEVDKKYSADDKFVVRQREEYCCEDDSDD